MTFKSIYNWLKNPEDNLAGRVIHGGIWAFALRITNRLFSLARTVVLARLLAPKDFGLFGIALITISTLQTFSNVGVKQALIQRKDINSHLDTAWTIQVIRGILIALIIFFTAPYVAIFFGEPPATTILRVIGFSALLHWFSNIGVIYKAQWLEAKILQKCCNLKEIEFMHCTEA